MTEMASQKTYSFRKASHKEGHPGTRFYFRFICKFLRQNGKDQCFRFTQEIISAIYWRLGTE